ncbi:MAG: inositol monophosphatase family protein [Acidimicrobiia bacterium]
MDDLQLARAAAVAAARIISEAGTRVADFKGAVDPVTAADREAEAAITAIIQRERPDDGFLAEEGSAAATEVGRIWVIDPLDGTVNFLHGVPQVAVSIALEIDGQAAVGVIRDVYRDEEFWAVRGAGAFLDGAPIAVSTTAPIGAALVSTGFAYDRQERADDYTRMVNAVLRVAQGLRRMGSVAMDLAWVACGRYDGHWEIRLAPWDVSAGLLLIQEAGGTTTSSDGGPATHHDLVATNGLIHEELRSAVRASLQSPVPSPQPEPPK